ncbi:alcohol dehydrogenase catalytic domain-containing protein [Diaminobutyricimonas sp. LJ205]|uniref:alcohol dehydrogenase catalytic domain-containing protein n=1 Tax=Diaminobutyricimonas sp. LJ205 TaxID=2683590 RepID=UPI0012F4F651|nr:alcohol dehydrogenase catalytic domain-containing protein [Diaminobutyricimonas sp. LJ205]
MHQGAKTPRSIELTPPAEAMVLRRAGEPLERMAVPLVTLGRGDVLVRIELAVLSVQDAETAVGRRRSFTPVVLGSEGVGHVVALGAGRPPRTPDNLPIKLGMRVAWEATVSCGRCGACRLGASCSRARQYGSAHVERGWELSGTLATHVHLLRRSVIRIAEPVEESGVAFDLLQAGDALDFAARTGRALVRPRR